MIERQFDVPFIAGLAFREKQIQQNYRPIISVHKWFARRPGTLFRGLILSEYVHRPLADSYYCSNDLHGVAIADPFMGGGTPLLEANRLGCDVTGYDINPMAYWIVKQEIEHLDLGAYLEAARALRAALEVGVGTLYQTRCALCGDEKAHAKYFLWVKAQACRECGSEVALFPGYLVAENRRHPRNVLLCPACGELAEVDMLDQPGQCGACGGPLAVRGPARGHRCSCPRCGHANAYPDPQSGPPRHRLFAIEYYCPHCKARHHGRFFKKPDEGDLLRVAAADTRWHETRPLFVPDEEIPTGDETNRLHRWGYRRYREMFNARQLLGLELSCRLIHDQPVERIRNALATNLSDLLRYQNMLCRYDTMALKSLDIFSVHGFPVGLIQCESNLLGVQDVAKSTNVGSGGWSNIIDKFAKAKSYCDEPFEIRRDGRRKVRVAIADEWIGDSNGGDERATRKVEISCANAADKVLAPDSIDGVFTDPPYYGNVQYAELMDFCYVWLRRLVGERDPAFHAASTRNTDELTGNLNMGRGLESFAEGLSSVFRRMASALKPGSPLVFTYHHNELHAYYPVAVAILDAGLTCSASLPCPAEMGASIHISGTGSSIVDTVFVCRATGSVARRWLAQNPREAAALVEDDVAKLRLGNVEPTAGDIRCIIHGHLVRLAVWSLRTTWRGDLAANERIAKVAAWVAAFGGLSAVQDHLTGVLAETPAVQSPRAQESETDYGADYAEVRF